MKAALALFLMASPAAAQAEKPKTCTYEVYNWNVREHRAVNFSRVAHPYSELKKEEQDPATGCTVCLEDQVELSLPGLKPFLVCRLEAPAVKAALEKLLAAGEPVTEVTGYRPGRTKNPLDKAGNRTGFSNHAYGAAVDINRSKNGLYENCPSFGPGCRLIQGGPWRPGAKGALTADSPIVRAMREAGFKWGGEIPGRQKDFMHFSSGGY